MCQISGKILFVDVLSFVESALRSSVTVCGKSYKQCAAIF